MNGRGAQRLSISATAIAVDQPLVVGRAGRFECDPRLAEEFTVASEAHLDSRSCMPTRDLIERGRNPAGPQRGAEFVEGIDLPLRRLRGRAVAHAAIASAVPAKLDRVHQGFSRLSTKRIAIGRPATAPPNPSGERQRRAAFERGVDRMQVGFARLGRRAGADIGHARRGDDLAAALEGKSHRHLHAGPGFVLRGRNPAGAERIEHRAQGVELVVRGIGAIRGRRPSGGRASTVDTLSMVNRRSWPIQ